GRMIQIVSDEIVTENRKIILDEQRRPQQICATKYPVLMVHGVFFRDFRYFNYWGRIPRALEANGARIFYGNH
ncbi:triacylglycerol lipase, partial [Klebsiella oxytoca]